MNYQNLTIFSGFFLIKFNIGGKKEICYFFILNSIKHIVMLLQSQSLIPLEN